MEQIEVKRFLLDKGIPPHIKGFEYLTQALQMCQKEKKYLYELTKSLYRDIASVNNDTSSKTERALRNALSFLPNRITIGRFLSLSLIEIEELETKNKRRKHNA